MTLGDRVILRGDNEEAVQWVVRLCRGGMETRSGTLTRFLGIIEISNGWYLDLLTVQGVLCDAAFLGGNLLLKLHESCSRKPPYLVACFGFWGTKAELLYIYFRVGLELVRDPVAPSTERGPDRSVLRTPYIPVV